MADEETRYYLNGVHVGPSPDGDGLDLAATDGHRLYVYHVSAPVSPALPAEGAILPRRFIEVLLRLKPTECRLTITGHHVKAEFDFHGWHMGLAAELVAGSYPHYRRVIPGRDAAAHVLTARVTDLKAAVEQALLVTDRAAMTQPLTFATTDSGVVTVAARNHDTGAHAVVEVEGAAVESKPTLALRIGLNGPYILDVLKLLGGGTMTFYIQEDPAAPVRIEAAGAPDWTGVLMPVRLN
jgi:DNA polymerase III sliding clamp (beta) subunit (PCNA family)